MKKIRNRQGFTLVELMVVVAIMGVLIAIAVPAYNNVTAGAETSVCKANMRTYDSAATQAIIAGETLETAKLDTKNASLNKYMKNGDPVLCPSDNSAYQLTVDSSTGNYTITCTGKNKDPHNKAAEVNQGDGE